MAKVNKINAQTIHNIRRKSALAIPDRATDKGWSATSIKQALVGLIVNANDSVISEINRIVEEINTIENATKWLFGSIVSDENLTIAEDLLQDVYLGDYYLNNRSGNVYTCVSKENGFLTFEYVFNIKDMFDNESNDTETEISYTLENNLDKTFKAENIESMELIIPNSVNHGFCSGVNFKVGDISPSFTITNNSSFPLKMRVYGMEIENYIPSPNRTIAMSIYCDDINVYCYVNEIA
jgi:hypothetical protein